MGGALISAWVSSPDLSRADPADIEIVADPRPQVSARMDLGLDGGSPRAACGRERSARTIREALLPGARRILVHQYDPEWRDLETIREYIRRLLPAEPEGGALFPHVYWAEGRPSEIVASIEFSSGPRRPLRLANGYAHFQDESGCEWWARYLGGDRSKWVVRP